MGAFSWGVDGYGRCHICISGDNTALFCGLDDVSGKELVFIYENFGAGSETSSSYTNGAKICQQ